MPVICGGRFGFEKEKIKIYSFPVRRKVDEKHRRDKEKKENEKEKESEMCPCGDHDFGNGCIGRLL